MDKEEIKERVGRMARSSVAIATADIVVAMLKIKGATDENIREVVDEVRSELEDSLMRAMSVVAVKANMDGPVATLDLNEDRTKGEQQEENNEIAEN